MIAAGTHTGKNARTRTSPGTPTLTACLGPALGVLALFFGGGLFLGLLQSVGYLSVSGSRFPTLAHFQHVFSDPGFYQSLWLTLYISLTSTVIAAAVSVGAAIALLSLSSRNRLAYFVFQIPLTVPHLVIAVAMIFLLAPTGFVSRAASSFGLIESSAQFPLLINDPWGIGIMATYIWKEIPFITLMILSVLRNAGGELLEAGSTLKADRWQRFRFIILPMIFPSLAAASLIVFAYTFGAFEVPYLLGRTYPMMLPVRAYRDYSDVDLMARPEGIATGLIIAAIVAVCIVLSQALTRLARRRGAAF